MYLSNQQKRLLKKLKKMPRMKTELNKKELRHISYFSDNGLIRFETIYENEHSLKEKGTLIHIKPKGEALYSHIVEDRRRWLIPVIISVAALIISVFAIFISSQSATVCPGCQESSFTTNAAT